MGQLIDDVRNGKHMAVISVMVTGIRAFALITSDLLQDVVTLRGKKKHFITLSLGVCLSLCMCVCKKCVGRDSFDASEFPLIHRFSELV